MMKKTQLKRVFSVLLAALMLTVSVQVAFSVQIVDSGFCGSEGDGANLTWTLDSQGQLTISGEGEMAAYWDYTSVPWYDYRSSISSVVVENGVTSVGLSAFERYYNLESADISESVKTIGAGAFWCCDKLKEVNLVAGIESIGDNAFEKCSSLQRLSIPETVSSIGEAAFGCCSGLTSIEVAAQNEFFECDENGVLFDKGYTRLIQYPCGSNLTYYEVPNSVKTICTESFATASSLRNVILPSGLINLGEYCFFECTNLLCMDIPDGVSNIERAAFSGCKMLENVTFGQNVESIGVDAFCECERLEDISIPEGVKTIESGAFHGCKKLTTVAIPQCTLEIGNNVFSGCEELRKLSIPEGVKTIGYGLVAGTALYEDEANWENGALYIDKCLINTQWVVGDFRIKSGTLLTARSSLSGNKKMTSVTIPEGLKYIGADCFALCSSLESISIPKSVELVGAGAFSGCTALKAVRITNLSSWCKIDFQGVYMNGVFSSNPLYYAHDLYLLDSLVTCLQIPDDTTSISEHAFYNCKSIKSVIFPDAVTAIGGYAFRECENITSIKWSNNLQSIGAHAFDSCVKLESLVLPNSVSKLETNAFKNCSGLTSVVLSDNLSVVGLHNFENCYKLEKIMIPSSVKFIESYAFNGCSALRDVFYIGDANSWNRMHFGSNNDPIINASVHYNHKHESGIPVKENEVSATETQGGSYDEVVYCAACGAEISRTSKTIVPLGIEQQTESPAGSTTKPQKLNFFQRIIQWFRSLFARLFKR